MKGLFCIIFFIGLIHLRPFNCNRSPPPELRCPSDTCPNNEYSDSNVLLKDDRNCFCDHDCEIYGDCCSKIKQNIRSSQQQGLTSCVINPSTQLGNISMFIKCPSYWNDGNVRQRCEQENGDAFTNAPVTNSLNNRTYKNLDCAKCNEEKLEHLIYWITSIECPLEGPGYKFKNFLQILELGILQHNSSNKLWYLAINQNRIPCHITLVPMNNNLRPCKISISECTKNWVEKDVQTQCRMYTAYRYGEINGNVYKNYDCAKCNFDSQPLRCESKLVYPGTPGGPEGSKSCLSYNCIYIPMNPPICEPKYAWSVKYKCCVTCNPLEKFNGTDCILE